MVLYVRFFESLALWTLFTHPTDINLIIVRGKNDLSVLVESENRYSMSRNRRNLAVIVKSFDLRPTINPCYCQGKERSFSYCSIGT